MSIALDKQIAEHVQPSLISSSSSGMVVDSSSTRLPVLPYIETFSHDYGPSVFERFIFSKKVMYFENSNNDISPILQLVFCMGNVWPYTLGAHQIILNIEYWVVVA